MRYPGFTNHAPARDRRFGSHSFAHGNNQERLGLPPCSARRIFPRCWFNEGRALEAGFDPVVDVALAGDVVGRHAVVGQWPVLFM